MFPSVRHIANKRGACHTITKKGDRGMKTTKLFLIPIILVALIFTSCSDYDYGYDEKTIRYERGFYEHFGKIDPNQDWNLVKQLREKNGRGTRGTDPGAVDNPENYPNLYQPNTFSYNQLEIVRLFFQNNKYLEGITYPWDEFFAQQIYTGNTKCGTQYGSASDCKETYEAADGSSCTPSQMNEFHVKSASGDYHFHIDSYNNGSYNRGKDGGMYVTDADASSFGYNNSAMGYIAGNTIIIDGETIDKWAKGEGASILKKLGIPFESVAYSISKTPSGEELPMKRYFLGFDFSLLDGDDAYNGSSITIKGVQYRCLKDQKNHYAGDLININNFGSVKDIYEKITDFDKEAPTYTQYYEDLKKLKYCIENGYSPVGQNGDWVKLGTTRNGYYSDWIMAITPGTYSHGTPDYEPDPEPDPEPKEEILEAGLLCCEDMGGVEADFDFNDIVLKLEHKRVTTTENSAVSTKDIFVVTAMAAGGTLPSYVFYKPLKNVDGLKLDFGDDWMNEAWNNEKIDSWVPFKTEDDKVSNGVHDMWSDKNLSGQTSFEPLNVGDEFKGEGHSWEVDITAAIEAMRAYENSNEEEQEMIRHYADHYVSYVFDRVRIRIYVNPVMNADGSVNTNDQNSNYIEPLRRGGDSDVEHDDKIVSETPRMLLLPLRFEWPTESTFIGEAYQDFGKWVNNAEITEWYLNKVDDNVTSRNIFGEEELQPRLRWGSNADGATEEIYMSVTLKSGESMTIPFTTLSDGNLTLSSSDNNIAYATNVDKNRKQITITANNPGTTTITLTQDAWTGVIDDDFHQYRSESIMLYVTVEGNGTPEKPEKPEEPEEPEGDITFSESDKVTVNKVENHLNTTGLTSYQVSASIIKSCQYGAWVKVVFDDVPSQEFSMQITNAWSDNIGNVIVREKEIFFELTEANIARMLQGNLDLWLNAYYKTDIVSVYIKPKTIEDALGTLVNGTLTANGYEIPNSAFQSFTTSATITFVCKGGANIRWSIDGLSTMGNTWNNPTFSVTLTGNSLAKAKQEGLKFTYSDNNSFSSVEARIKESSLSVKKRRTTRR